MADVSPESTQAVESVPAAELPPEGVVEAAAESGGDDGGPSDAERGELPSGPIDLTSMDFSGDAAALTRDDGHPKDAEKAAECKAKGNAHFGAGEWDAAVECYSEALDWAPVGTDEEKAAAAVYFANRGAALMQLEVWEDAFADCTQAMALNPAYVKAILRHASVARRLEKLDEAAADYERVLELEPGHSVATTELRVVKAAIAKRDEALKEEMFSKLKELGDTVLGNFGLSTDNFQFKQDPKTGGYNINFVQNPQGAGGKAGAK